MYLPRDYERLHHKLAPRALFYRRLAANAVFTLALIACALAAGMAGYRYIAGFSALDSFLNAAMILSGMGPVGEIPNAAGKIFAGFYAIFSGFLIVASTGVLLAPALHRMLHSFHLADDADERSTQE